MIKKVSPYAGKRMRKTLLSMYKKDPLAKRIINEFLRKQWIKKEILPHQKTAKMLAKIALMISLVSDDELTEYSKERGFKSIYGHVKKDFRNKSINPALVSEYKNRIKSVNKTINYFSYHIEKKIYRSKYSQIKNLEKSDRPNKIQLIEQIKKPILSNPENQPLIQSLAFLKFDKETVSEFPYNIDDVKENPLISENKLLFQKYLTLKIYKPDLFVTLFHYESRFQKFPLNWLLHLTISELRNLYAEYKRGRLRTDYFKSEVSEKNYFKSLLEKSQELPFFQKRKRFIEQIIENHQNKRYASSINLILPQIEALIWVIAAYLQKVKKVRIFRRAPIKNFWDFSPVKYGHIELIGSKGNFITGKQNITIRNLVSKTKFNEFLHETQVKFFVNELFEERNLILHGNIVDYDDELNSCKKIICFTHLINQFISKITDIDFAA